MTFWFRIAFTWWLGHFISCYLTVHFMLNIRLLQNRKHYACATRSSLPADRFHTEMGGRFAPFYMIPLRDFVPEWNSRPGAWTGVNSRRGDSRRHNILWWYHINKYRAMRGNRNELAPGRKSPRCHVNTPKVEDVSKAWDLEHFLFKMLLYRVFMLFSGNGHWRYLRLFFLRWIIYITLTEQWR